MSTTPIPCKFCGGEPVVKPIVVAYDTTRRTGRHQMLRCECPRCGAQGKCRPNHDAAVACWNEPWQAQVGRDAPATNKLQEAIVRLESLRNWFQESAKTESEFFRKSYLGDVEMLTLLIRHFVWFDRRQTELIAANNREVDRNRALTARLREAGVEP